MKKIVLFLILIVLPVSLVACSQEVSTLPEVEEEVEKKVKVASVQEETMGLEKIISLELLPASHTVIFAEISGNIIQKNVEVGQVVKKGQLLIELENKEMALNYKREVVNADKARIQLQKAKDEQDHFVKSAEKTLREREISLIEAHSNQEKHEQSIETAKQNVNKMTLQYEALERNHEYQTILLEHGSISQEEFNRSLEQVITLKIDLDLAIQQAEQAEKDLVLVAGTIENMEIQLERAKQQLDQAKASYNYQLLDSSSKETQVTQDLAKTQLDKRFLHSPIHGVIVKMDVNLGESVSPQLEIAHIEQHDTLQARTYISEHDLEKVAGREEFEITIPVLNATKKGKVTFLSTSKNNKENGYELRLEINNEDLSILPGMTTQLSLEAKDTGLSLIVPSNAIIEEEGKSYVYVIESNTALRREVQTGKVYKMNTEILEGLNKGEQIAIVGQSLLADKDKVKVLD